MATTLLTVTHLVCCALLLIFSFICITPLADVMKNFKGHCFIGANITIVKHPSYNVIADDLTGEASHCVFPEFMGFMVLIFSVVYLVWNSCLAFKSRESTWLDSFVGTVLSCVMTICMLISAAVISAGINKLCDRLGRGTFRCESVDYEPSNWLAWRDKDGVITYPEDLKTDGFYTKFQIAQAGCWLSFVTYLVVLGTYLIKLKYASAEGGFMQNMTQERDRLVDRTNQRRYDQI